MSVSTIPSNHDFSHSNDISQQNFCTSTITSSGDSHSSLKAVPSLNTTTDHMVTLSDDPMISGDYSNSTVDDPTFQTALMTDSSVLDISDPSVLLQMVNEGDLTMNPLFDQNGHELVINASASSAFPEDSVMCLPQGKPCIEEAIALSFVPPSTSTARSRAQKKGKQITRHRLLTSEDIISEKLKIEKIKQEKEALNKRRKLKNQN
jgi:hypothetical protein